MFDAARLAELAWDKQDGLLPAIVQQVQQKYDREVPSTFVGEQVMRALNQLDPVAYVRFASVYRKFEDVQAFLEEIARLEHDLPELERLQLSLLAGEAVAPRRQRKGRSHVVVIAHSSVVPGAGRSSETNLSKSSAAWKFLYTLAKRT